VACPNIVGRETQAAQRLFNADATLRRLNDHLVWASESRLIDAQTGDTIAAVSEQDAIAIARRVVLPPADSPTVKLIRSYDHFYWLLTTCTSLHAGRQSGPACGLVRDLHHAVTQSYCERTGPWVYQLLGYPLVHLSRPNNPGVQQW
jgi:hypothetical protein